MCNREKCSLLKPQKCVSGALRAVVVCVSAQKELGERQMIDKE